MDKIVLFAGVRLTDSNTGRENEDIKLFIDTAKKPSRERVLGERVAKAMLDFRIQHDDAKKIKCWQSLSDEDKEEAIKNTPFREDKKNTRDEIRDSFLYAVKSGSGIDYENEDDKENFNCIWDNNLEYIYSHSGNEWGLFKALGCDGVYAVEYAEWEKYGLKTWIEQLTHLALAIDSDVRKIYLAIHNGNIAGNGTFGNEEVSSIDERVGYVKFSHVDEDPYYKYLLRQATDVDTIYNGLAGTASKIKAATDSEIDPIGETYLDLIRNSNEGA